jgi:hypothetical protein
VPTKTSDGLQRQRLTSEHYCPQAAEDTRAEDDAVDLGPGCRDTGTNAILGGCRWDAHLDRNGEYKTRPSGTANPTARP